MGSSTVQHIREIIRRRISRRGFIGLTARSIAAAAVISGGYIPRGHANMGLSHGAESPNVKRFSFTPIAKNRDITHHIAEGYEVQTLISWGDMIISDVADGEVELSSFDAEELTAESQKLRFGYNNDYIAYIPLVQDKDGRDVRGLLCVNHEYPNSQLMFHDLPHDEKYSGGLDAIGRRHVDIEMAALGCSVVEIEARHDANSAPSSSERPIWMLVNNSKYNRRITATTPMEVRGHAAGDSRMKTEASPDGVTAIGTFANCAGGVTPWGTILTAEENINFYFMGLESLPKTHKEYNNHKRMGVGSRPLNAWGKFYDRFDVSKQPNEANHFGWIVEYDPHDPDSIPVKHTSMGRCKHECATTHLLPDGRVIVYSGDDEENEYIYRFISKGTYNPNASRRENSRLLDEGELSVAQFNADGTMVWLPLEYGYRGLTPDNGFNSQADIAIETRRAADIVGATPMDRPEDIAINPLNGNILVVMTKSKNKIPAANNAANPRNPNPYGHILELAPPPYRSDDSLSFAEQKNKGDHAANSFRWSVFLEGGRPEMNIRDSINSNWLTNPDNLAFDKYGRVWICSDGQESSIGMNEGIYAAQTIGKDKAKPHLFFTSPIGAEITGPEFTPDNRTLFLSIQHPAEDFGKSNYKNPTTRWPSFRDNEPPRPSIVAITNKTGQEIG